ncbi:MAG: hypothetical protein C4318_07415 [Acidimicrobiia bacterium]
MSPEVKTVYSAVVALIGVWFWIWSIVDTALADSSRFASANKAVWVTLTTALPVLGGMIYLVVGRNFFAPGRPSG